MPDRPNKNRLTRDTDKHLCTFLLSSFRQSGLKSYKYHFRLSFPEAPKQISNRLEYLKKISRSNVAEFSRLCDTYGIKPSNIKVNFQDQISVPQEIDPRMSTTSSNLLEQQLRRHQVNLNFHFPSLNSSGMLWFRDDDVEIGESMCSILTIYQPLFDARDYDDVNIGIDVDDPTLLLHHHPTVPRFFYEDFNKIHEQEESLDNPDIYTETRKKHKKHAFKIKNNKHLKIEMTEYQLPFALSLEAFDDISHNGSTLMKNYRTIQVGLSKKIKHTCSYVFWKVMIDGETTHCANRTSGATGNVFEDAYTRMFNKFENLDVNGEIPMDDDGESSLPNVST